MEKRTPHCKLPAVKDLIKAGRVRSTMSALSGGAALGFDFDGMVAIIMSLTMADFYKSMTTVADHKVWQDVYRTTTKTGEVYLKGISKNPNSVAILRCSKNFNAYISNICGALRSFSRLVSLRILNF